MPLLCSSVGKKKKNIKDFAFRVVEGDARLRRVVVGPSRVSKH